jgi:hypothetical protein
MTAVIDWKTGRDNLAPSQPGKCLMCSKKVSPPFVHWMADNYRDIFICASCCDRVQHGLTADMMRVNAFGKALRHRPEYIGPCAVQ